MITTLIVLAHPEQASFNSAWSQASKIACEDLGQRVLFSDLYSLGFDAAESNKHYPDLGCDGLFDPLKAQERVSETGDIPTEIAREVVKLEQADQVIFHFPIWWFAPPAILKGWFDRVFLHGRVHSVDERFDKGKYRGKSAMLCVSTGANEVECGFSGKEGDAKMWLWPVAQTLRYLGSTIKEPEIIHGVHGYHAGQKGDELELRLGRVLERQAALIAGLAERSEWRFNRDHDFDEEGRLKSGSTSYSHFIRHEP